MMVLPHLMVQLFSRNGYRCASIFKQEIGCAIICDKDIDVFS